MPPASAQASSPQASMTHSPSSHARPAAGQVATSQTTAVGGGSSGGASGLFPSGPTSGGVAQASTKPSISKFSPSSRFGEMSVSTFSTPVSSSKPANPALQPSFT